MLRLAVGLLFVIVAVFVRRDLALTVTEPSGQTTWHLHSPNTVEWESVSTDPGSIEVRLVNNNPATYPTGFTRTIKDGINTADNKFSVTELPGVKPGLGYQVNIMSSAGTILAQSGQFAINGTMESNSTATHNLSSSATLQPPITSAPAPATSAAASSDATTQNKLQMNKSAAVMVLSLMAALIM